MRANTTSKYSTSWRDCVAGMVLVAVNNRFDPKIILKWSYGFLPLRSLYCVRSKRGGMFWTRSASLLRCSTRSSLLGFTKLLGDDARLLLSCLGFLEFPTIVGFGKLFTGVERFRGCWLDALWILFFLTIGILFPFSAKKEKTFVKNKIYEIKKNSPVCTKSEERL